MRRAIIACLALAAPLAADMLSFDSAEEWAQWQQPFGLVQVGEQGQLSLVKFRKDINLVEDAHLFVHETRKRGDAVAGGLWQAGSNEADAPLAIDGDPTTYWQPSPDDAREDWFITIDLGRAALAREIRLKFPDQEGRAPVPPIPRLHHLRRAHCGHGRPLSLPPSLPHHAPQRRIRNRHPVALRWPRQRASV